MKFVCDLIQTLLLIAAVSLLALVLVLTEFAFIKKVSSLSLCIIGVVKVSCLLFWLISLRVPPVLLKSAAWV